MTQSNVVIRRAGAQDALAVGRVFAESWQEAYSGIVPEEYLSGITPMMRAKKVEFDLKNDPQARFYLMESWGNVAGALTICPCCDDDRPFCGEIRAIYLRPLYFGMGLGRQLLSFGVRELYGMGLSPVCLWVLEDNVKARRFYEACGFRFDGKRKEIDIGKSLTELRYGLM